MNNGNSLFTLRRGPNLRRKLFAEEFAIHGDGRRAAITAGYSSNGAAAAASRLLNIPIVQETISELREKAAAEVGVRAMKNLEKVRAKAVVSLAEYITFDHGTIRWKKAEELTPYQISALDHLHLSDAGDTVGLQFTGLHDALLELVRLAEIPGFGFGVQDEAA